MRGGKCGNPPSLTLNTSNLIPGASARPRAGVLTLRAQAGSIRCPLSDGSPATGTGAFTLPDTATVSWFYDRSSGADFTAADPQAVSHRMPRILGTVTLCDALCAASIVHDAVRAATCATMVEPAMGSST